jgi:hypothetical protein
MPVRKPTVSQVLPSARIIPRIIVPDNLKGRLTEMASQAYGRYHRDSDTNSDTEPFAVSMAPVRVQSAVEFYVSEKEFEMKLPAFRKMLRDGDLRKATNALSRALGSSDTLPPFAQMRSLFCYVDPNSNGLEYGGPEQIKQRQEREDLWDTRFSAARLGELLGQWQSLMDQLHRLTGAGRTPIMAERGFVSALARYWTGELGCKLYSARAHSFFKEGVEAKQAGAFANFVRAAAEIIPTNYRPTAWDHAIREVIDAMKSREN